MMSNKRVSAVLIATFLASCMLALLMLAVQVETVSSRTRSDSGLVPPEVPAAAETSIGAPSLFIGLDNALVPTYLMEPATNVSTTLFSGYEVHGAAYDPDHNRILFIAGSLLYEWPVSGTVSLLGTVTNTGGNALAMVGLAYHDGVLYGTCNLPNEAVYIINTTTLVATVFIDYIDSGSDLGGLAADPGTGALYATNDSSNEVVRIELDGTIDPVVAYPPGQSDIDGLAISADGLAYLVTDEPGYVYIYDLVAGAYLSPLLNPWTSAENFSGAAYITAPSNQPGPAINLTKTVGIDATTCASTSEITVEPGTPIYYCYLVRNSGDVTLTLHDLTDTSLGQLFGGWPYTLAPGATIDTSSAGLVISTTVMTRTTGAATWTAYNPGNSDLVTATATTTVHVVGVPAIAVAPVSLASEQAVGSVVVLPLDITNTGTATLTWAISEEAPAHADSVHDRLPLGTTAYGWNSRNGRYYTVFDLASPDTLPNIANFDPSGVFIGAGEYYGGSIYMLDEANHLWQVDPTSGAVLDSNTVAAPPGSQIYSGLAYDPVSGAVYASSTDVSGSTLFTLDLAGGNVTPVGPVSNAPGIIAIAIDGTGELYGYDVVTDMLLRIDKDTGTGTVVGPIGFDANFGQGMAYDPATDTMFMAAFNNIPDYRAELRAVDTTTGNTTLLGVLGETLPGGLNQLGWLAIERTPFETCDPAPFAWVSVSPQSGTTAPGETSGVTITFDAAGLAPGVYTGTLCIESNDPTAALLRVPLEMTVFQAVYGVELEGDLVQIGEPGSVLAFPLTLTNTGNVPDGYSLEILNNTWSAVLSEDFVALGVGDSAMVEVVVQVPHPAPPGAVDEMIVVAISEGDPATSATVTLVGAVRSEPVYLPLVSKE